MNNHLPPQGNNQADYYLPMTMPFVYRFACLSIALQNSEEAREIYLKIIESYRLLDVRKATNQVMSEIDRDKRKISDDIKASPRKSYPSQERRLMNALRMKLATDNVILDELNQMKKEREEDLSKLNKLLQTRDNITRNIEMEEHLKELCSRVIDNLDNCTCQEKKNAYTYLDLKVIADPESIGIKGYVAPNVLTIVRTSAL